MEEPFFFKIIQTFRRVIHKPFCFVRSRAVWHKREQNFREFLSKIKDYKANSSDTNEIAIVIQPWLLTPLPWYLLFLAYAFYRHGKKTIVVWDDMNSDFKKGKWQQRFQQNSIRRVLQMMPKVIKYVSLSTYANKKLLKTYSSFEHLVCKNYTIYNRGETGPSGRSYFRRKITKKLKETASCVQLFLQDVRPSIVIIGGGGYGSSGLWIDLAKPMNIRVASIDSSFSMLW